MGMKTVINALEKAAQEIRGQVRRRKKQHTSNPLASIEVQIAFWSDQLEKKRKLYKKLLHQILVDECSVRTDLVQLTNPYHGNPSLESGAQNRLKDRLLELDRERRRASITHESEKAEIHEKLLHLLTQHSLLNPAE